MSIQSKTLTGALGSFSGKRKQNKTKIQNRMVGQFNVRPKRSRQKKSSLKGWKTKRCTVVQLELSRQVVGQQISFQDRKKENTLKFPASNIMYTRQPSHATYVDLSYLQLFLLNILSLLSIGNTRFEIIFFTWIQTYRIFYFSRRGYLLNTRLYVPGIGFSVAGLDRTKFGFYRFQNLLFIVVIVISILVKTAFWQTSIQIQSLVKIL